MEEVRVLTGRDFFTVKPQETALLVIDMQVGFLDPSSPYDVPPGRDIIPKLRDLIHFCRTAGLPIIWTQSDHSAPYGGLFLKKYPPIAKDKVLWKGHPTHEISPLMDPQPAPGEYRIVKHKYDAFYGTDLEILLKNLSVTTVIVTGVATCVCCESTARSAFMRDFQVVFPSDGNADFNAEGHRATLMNIDFFFGRVCTVDELMAEMKEAL